MGDDANILPRLLNESLTDHLYTVIGCTPENYHLTTLYSNIVTELPPRKNTFSKVRCVQRPSRQLSDLQSDPLLQLQSDPVRINAFFDYNILAVDTLPITQLYTCFPILEKTNPNWLINRFLNTTDGNYESKEVEIECKFGITYKKTDDSELVSKSKKKILYLDEHTDTPIDIDISVQSLLDNPSENPELKTPFSMELSDFIIVPDVYYNLILHIDPDTQQSQIQEMLTSGTLNQLHLGFTAFCKNRKLVTFRDLDASHVFMLVQLKYEIYKFIFENLLKINLQEQLAPLQEQLAPLQEQLAPLQELYNQIIEIYKQILDQYELHVVITTTLSLNSPGTLTFDVELKSTHMFNNESEFYIGSNKFNIDELIHNITIPGYTELKFPAFAQENLVRSAKFQQLGGASGVDSGGVGGTGGVDSKAGSVVKIDPTKYKIGCCYWDKITLRVLWTNIDTLIPDDPLYYVMEIRPSEYISNEFKYLFTDSTDSPTYLFGNPLGKQYYYRDGNLKYSCTITPINVGRMPNLKSFMIQYPDKPFYLGSGPNQLSIVQNLITFVNTKYLNNKLEFIQKLVLYKLLFQIQPNDQRWIHSLYKLNVSLWYRIINTNWLLLKSNRGWRDDRPVYILWYIPNFFINTPLWKELQQQIRSINDSTTSVEWVKLIIKQFQTDSISQLYQLNSQSEDLENGYKSNILEFDKATIENLYTELAKIIPDFQKYILKFHIFTTFQNLLPHFHIIYGESQKGSVATVPISEERHSRTFLLDLIKYNDFDLKQLKIEQFGLVSNQTKFDKLVSFYT